MAGFGSAANPVRLDPFRRLVEVGWSSGEYLAFDMGAISLTDTVVALDQSCPIKQDAPEPGAYSDDYIETAQWSATFAESIIGPRIWNRQTESWDASPGNGTVTGYPTLPGAFSFGPLERSTPYLPRWTPSSDGGLDIPVPGMAEMFDAQTSAEGHGVSDVFTGLTYCEEFSGGLLRTVGQIQFVQSAYAALSLNLANVVVRVGGKAYSQIGVKALNVTDQVETGLTSGTRELDVLWVLCRRAPSLDN
jgi:hypothetical protein